MAKVALITGGSAGIGEAIALALARDGIRVAVAARTLSGVERVAAVIRANRGEALAVICDVKQPDSIATAIEKVQHQFGNISILINNAAASASQKFAGHNDSLWFEMMDANLNSVYYVTKALVLAMIETRWGRIINIASIASKVGGKYIAAKHGVLGLTRALAVELAPYNVTVNAICPSYVDTPMTDRSIARIVKQTNLSEPSARATLEKPNLQNRLITPAEVAAVAVMLIQDQARGITGQAINVDGSAVMF